MDSRERILSTLRGQRPDRIGVTESPWSETITRWRTEGLPENVDLADYFNLDFASLPWLDVSLRLPTEVFEETDQYIHHRDANGVERKDWKTESGHTPHWLSFTLQTGSDWWKYKERLDITPDRLSPQMEEAYRQGRSKGRFVQWAGLESYECVWPMFGQVNIFSMMMEEPEVVKDIFMTYTDFIIGHVQILLDRGLDFDGAWFYGDVGYRNGLLFSPACYNELLFPAHKKMCQFFNDLNKPVILHSCGKILSLIPKFIEAGFSAIQPLEAKCGQDIRELCKDYGGKITFFGNMDVRMLSGTREDIRNEVLPKLEAAATNGGYIFHSDHSVPPTVSLENYQYALELLADFNRKHYGS